MNRALRAATMGVLLVSPIALSACSAGQVTQTATQVRDRVGATAEVGELTLRAVTLAYPRGGTYDAGDDAELLMAVANAGTEDDTLIDISGDGFGDAEIEGTSGSAAGSGGLEIPGRDRVFVGAEDGPTIMLTDLDRSLSTGEGIELTLTFQEAGEVTVLATVGTPDEALQRGEPFDFHHEEEAEGEEAAH
ncbi:copper chaperone PCu(A)C [Blastococcus montanus]|uniref:copper chaperone PCu(A)C n=1 Tax=Blastococcus montanus TaxID=3144973 RepID=UPI00320843AC